MEEEIKHNLSSKDTWIRIFYMVLFAIFYSVAEIVLTAVVIIQLGFILLSGKKNDRLINLGQSLSTYIYQVLSFQTFNSETLQYPFSAWPAGEPKARPKSKAKSKSEIAAADENE